MEPPSQKRKPLCERHLHRRIRSAFAFPRRRQAGLGECRQAIGVKRLPHRRELAAEAGGSRRVFSFQCSVGGMEREQGAGSELPGDNGEPVLQLNTEHCRGPRLRFGFV